MVSFVRILKEIKALHIQGAQNIARSALYALKQKTISSKAITKTRFLAELEEARKLLFSARPTEPCLRNCFNFVLISLDGFDVFSMKKECLSRIEKALLHLELSDERIAEIGCQKIKSGMTVFTHCHSSTVMHILRKARNQKKVFTVHNTETRPLFQGRKTAQELSKLGIPVTHFIDAAARYALKKSDIMLIGADALSSEGKIINKIGSELFSEIAHKYDIPVYVCTDSWKFDAASVFGYEEEIEIRNSSEIWKKPPKGVTIHNYAFEKIDPDLVTGIISELGIYKPAIFVEELKRNYSWMFK
jgi:ribose 1,5-bisphosphate isomerase